MPWPLFQSAIARIGVFTIRALLHALVASGVPIEPAVWRDAYPYRAAASGVIRNRARLTDGPAG